MLACMALTRVRISLPKQVLNIVIDETITETLENDNMALQNMSSVRAWRMRGLLRAVPCASSAARALERATR
jgi:hypothetical protein